MPQHLIIFEKLHSEGVVMLIQAWQGSVFDFFHFTIVYKFSFVVFLFIVLRVVGDNALLFEEVGVADHSFSIWAVRREAVIILVEFDYDDVA